MRPPPELKVVNVAAQVHQSHPDCSSNPTPRTRFLPCHCQSVTQPLTITVPSLQFALVRELTVKDVDLPLEVVTMAVAETMASVFEAVGQCVAISPEGKPLS